jgi:hypothetical protein
MLGATRNVDREKKGIIRAAYISRIENTLR